MPNRTGGASTKRAPCVFVTVGSTSFDALVEALESEELCATLLRKGYTRLQVQLGRATHLPSFDSCPSAQLMTPLTQLEEAAAPPPPPPGPAIPVEGQKLEVEVFRYAPSIQSYLQRAGLVVTHAGSGSVFEALRCGAPTVVVANEQLMDNHQAELAEELQQRGHVFSSSPSSLLRDLRDKLEDAPKGTPSPPKLVRYQPERGTGATSVVAAIDAFVQGT